MLVKNQRRAYGETLVKMGVENKNVVVLEADLGKSTMSCLFQEAFPERYFEMGIAEANMASTAAGLSLTGKIPFIGSFAVFASGRAYDQIRQSICIAGLNVKICGSSSGLSDFGDGSTHQAVEDVAIMRAIPNMTVLVPADAVETEKMVRAMVENHGPMYIRISRNDLPVYTPEEQEFKIGRMYTIKEGGDAVIFANGIMISKAVSAAAELEKIGISAKVVNVSTVKPLDRTELLQALGSAGGIVTAEEHSLIGGLGSAIGEAMAGCVELPVRHIGIKDRFGTSAGSYDELLEEYGLTEAEIIKAVKEVLRK